MPKAVVLVSGGMDSATLLYHLRDQGYECRALAFDYGQRHGKELYAAETICDGIDIPFLVADLTAINPLIRKGSQSGEEQPPDGHYTELSMKTTIVPNRNAIMLSIAVGHAITIDASEVCFASHSGDHAIYPDCRAEFVNAFAKAMWLGNEWTPVHVRSPFIMISKANIVTLGKKLRVPFELTWSCYKGLERHCGTCGTCVERKEAFSLAEVEDPTVYA